MGQSSHIFGNSIYTNVFLPAFVFIAYPNLDHLATSKVPFATPYFKFLAGDHIAHLNDFSENKNANILLISDATIVLIDT